MNSVNYIHDKDIYLFKYIFLSKINLFLELIKFYFMFFFFEKKIKNFL
jgi:hypothetical protein